MIKCPVYSLGEFGDDNISGDQMAAQEPDCSDISRWKVKEGAEIIGYVSEVKRGGIEATNCHAREMMRIAIPALSWCSILCTAAAPYRLSVGGHSTLAVPDEPARGGLVNPSAGG